MAEGQYTWVYEARQSWQPPLERTPPDPSQCQAKRHTLFSLLVAYRGKPQPSQPNPDAVTRVEKEKEKANFEALLGFRFGERPQNATDFKSRKDRNGIRLGE